ncbi:formyltransferase family protein [Roseateles sp.]|uniref:formyltransferase family protein n=1 Tax=Roseateles sp. TaxID=1971397 RepID=UPI0039E8D583
MFFIGSGALCYQAVDFALHAGHRVDGVYCPPGDATGKRLERRGVKVTAGERPGEDLPALLVQTADGVVFSINNAHLLPDELLRCGPRFFNIHNGLVQRYRGIAEVCIFAALCRGEARYGATLHELLPGQKVDTGPVVAQLDFDIGADAGFADVMHQSLATCQRLFEQQLAGILAGGVRPVAVTMEGSAFSYRSLSGLIAACDDPLRLARASRLGPYAGFFKRLSAALAEPR